MTGLSTAGILQVWEWGRQRHPVDRALLVLAASDPAVAHDALAGMTVGQRDARLLDVREATFGSRLDGLADCPACSSTSEFAISTDAVSVRTGDAEPFEAEADGYRLRLRALNSRDLAAIASIPDAAAARRALCERAVVSGERDGTGVPADSLPDDVADVISRLVGERDPQADVSLALCCPDCDHRWEAPFDITSFLWTDIAASARRLLHEVHTLARAYGWREDDVLALSPARRQTYLELAGSP